MMSKTYRGPIVFGLLAGLALVATADDQPPIAANEEKVATEEQAAVLETTETATPLVYHLNGMTIAWNVETGVSSPTMEQAAAMAEEFNKWVEARVADGRISMPAEQTVEMRTLSNGMRAINLPAKLLSASVVRVDENGKLVTDCAEGAEATGQLLRQPVQSTRPEEK